jgi:hypothetical protein
MTWSVVIKSKCTCLIFAHGLHSCFAMMLRAQDSPLHKKSMKC